MNFVIILTLLIKQILWLAFIPIWQFPDEQAHFAQVQNIAENQSSASNQKLSTSREIFESEKLFGTNRDGFGNNKYTYHSDYNIQYSETTTGKEELKIKEFPNIYRKELTIRESTGYPPLYYEFSAWFYKFVYNSDLISRIFVTRLFNLFLFFIFYFIISKISNLLFNNNILLKSTYIIILIFNPMLSFLFSGINSDNLYNVISVWVVYLGLKLLKKGLSITTFIQICLSILLAMYTKPQGFCLSLFYIYPLIYLFFNKNKLSLKCFISLLVIGIIAFGGIIRNILLGRQILPDLPPIEIIQKLSLPGFLIYLKSIIVHTYREIIPWYWGVYRWLSLTYPRIIHRILNWITVFSILGLIGHIYQKIKLKEKKEFLVLGYLIYISMMYFAVLAVFDYIFNISHGFSFGIQGRYFFPTIAAHMGILLIGIFQIIPKIIQNIVIKILGLGFISFHLYAQNMVLFSYFDTSSFYKFFIQASQYKPVYFKYPWLLILTITFFLSLIIFIWYYLHIKANKYEKN
ncbi:MAG: hypothetical protein UR52_C0001G0021 [Candidatus Gottesmanbacteria bacterium GW2011_GWA1_34_13]|uniref:Uncharacterized protein n=1 Tax=Candidatus Gottesmanbacteria bacterium GW2011_GWA1_34_13 TaxID=1618434 RepID=A0A0G0B8A1_9BACT|nr:MAG: hypothetical protein UR52_C0001G0021 [Candidatus Gottesmanbacteria bacterium GW2011_GWA1_34_13]